MIRTRFPYESLIDLLRSCHLCQKHYPEQGNTGRAYHYVIRFGTSSTARDHLTSAFSLEWPSFFSTTSVPPALPGLFNRVHFKISTATSNLLEGSCLDTKIGWTRQVATSLRKGSISRDSLDNKRCIQPGHQVPIQLKIKDCDEWIFEYNVPGDLHKPALQPLQ